MANEDLGALRISLGLNDSNFTGNIPKINRQLKIIDSEFKAASTSVGGFEDSLSSLQSQSTNVEKKLQLQRVKVDELKRQYDELVRTKGADSKAAENMLIRYNKTVATMNRTEQALQSVNKEIEVQSSEWAKVSKEADQALSKISRELATTKSEFKAATAGIENFGEETMDLRQKSEHLERVLGLENQAVEQLNRKYREAVRAKGNDAEETHKLLVEYNNAKARARETESEMNRLTNTISEQTSRIGILRRRVNEAQNSFDDFGNNAQNVGGNIVSSFGIATAAMGAGFGLASKKSMDFEAQLSSIKALTGASSEEMKKMRDLSIEMGSKTVYSSLEAAQAIEELLKAGLTPAQVQAGGLEQALSLATAGGLDLAKAAEIMSTGLNTFKKDGMEAADASNILAGSANASATSVEELQYGLAAVGTVADGTGFSFRDTAAALGVFANNGLKGSDAGTSLKTMLANLQPQTKAQVGAMIDLGLMTRDGSNAFFDAAGNVKSMAEVAGLLQNALKDQTNEQRQATLYTLFGSDAVRAGNILYKEGKDGINDFKKAMGNVTAEEVATEKLNNLKGDIEQLKGSFETLQISVGETIEPMVKLGVDGVQKLVDGFNDLSPGMKKTVVGAGVVATGILGIVTAGGLLLSFVGTASIGLGAITGVMGSLGIGAASAAGGVAAAGAASAGAAGGVGLLGGALTLVTGPIGLTVAAVAALTAGGVLLYKNWDTVNATLNKNPFLKIIAYANPVTGSLLGVVGGIKKVQTELNRTGIETGLASDKISNGTKKAIKAYMDLDNKAYISMVNLSVRGGVVTTQFADKQVQLYNQMAKRIEDSMNQDHAKRLSKTKELFAKNAGLTAAEEAQILKKMDDDHANKKLKLEQYKNQESEIWRRAAKEKRDLTESEKRTVNGIRENMRVMAVQTLSKSEAEQKMILGRLKNDASNITAQQAANVVKNSATQRDKSVKNANDQYKKTVKEIEYMRDVTGDITAAQAKSMIADAKKQKDESVKHAEDMHKKVVKEAKLQAEGHIGDINWETGEVLDGWDRMMDGIDKAVNWISGIFGEKKSTKSKPSIAHKKGDTYGSLKNNGSGRAIGTPYGGTPNAEIALTGEEGPELVKDGKTGQLGITGARGPEYRYLSKGSSVLPANLTTAVLQKYGFGKSMPAYAEGIGIGNFDDIMKGPSFLWDKAVSKFGLSDNLVPKWLTNLAGSPLKYIEGLATNKIQGLIDKFMSSFGGDGSYTGIGGYYLGSPFRITTNFTPGGNKNDKVHKGGVHYGLDLAAPSGTPIKSLTNGVAAQVLIGNKTAGNGVRIQSGADLLSYIHMKSAPLVKQGQAVKEGQVIGYVGSTGEELPLLTVMVSRTIL
ncbi:phage tail tape measure protein [Priestia aryabhattai]|uniref:Phage tail tape measure protein n=1 Tax=Priestia aryabhattai TaxID=412384 RepID=A0ABD7X3J5_PRIAR|nr:phage tail tape measure protein [Priestia aryabhattai]WEA47289.1 phage tail tape measure protein [Priestia aryabhattai]